MPTRRAAWAVTVFLIGAVIFNSSTPAWPTGYFSSKPSSFPAAGMVHVLSAGDGQVLLLQCADRAALIGAGPDWAAPAVAVYLRDQQIDSLEAVLVADTSYNHASGMKSIIELFSVGAFYDASAPTAGPLNSDLLDELDRIGLPYQRLRAGQRLILGCLELHVLAPAETGPVEEGAASRPAGSSGVFSITGASHRILYAGNIDSDAEKSLVRMYPELNVDVLIVARGGHKSATSQVFLEHFRPQLAIIPVGGYNEEGRPHTDVLKRLNDAGVRVLRTDRHGTVALGLTPRGLRVTLRPHLTTNR